MNEIERVTLLLSASPLVRLWREQGRTWEYITNSRRTNPLGLSKRQMVRIYSDEGQETFDKLRRKLKSQDTAGVGS